jgi:hypothetical protein
MPANIHGKTRPWIHSHIFILVVAGALLLILDVEVLWSIKPGSTASKTGPECPLPDLKNQNYTWWGNQWIPPPGVPYYTQEDMLDAFSQFDTLWIGDSTTRRAYATLYALLNAPVGSSLSVDALDSPRVLDVNKHQIDEDSCGWQRENAGDAAHIVWPPASICRSVANGGRKRAFDYTRANCFKQLRDIAGIERELRRYSLVIIGLGIWDATVKRMDCKLTPDEKDFEYEGLVPPQEILSWVGLPNAQRMATLLHHRNETRYAEPSAVLWRTTGFNAQNQSTHYRRIHDFNRRATAFSKESDVVLIDWGGAIESRSFAKDRISGDSENHYGIAGRLLFAQMATQQINWVLQEHHHSTK